MSTPTIIFTWSRVEPMHAVISVTHPDHPPHSYSAIHTHANQCFRIARVSEEWRDDRAKTGTAASVRRCPGFADGTPTMDLCPAHIDGTCQVAKPNIQSRKLDTWVMKSHGVCWTLIWSIIPAVAACCNLSPVL